MKRGLTILELIITIATLLIIAAIVPLVWNRFATESHDIRRVGAVRELQRTLKTSFLSHGIYPISKQAENITAESKVITSLISDFLVAKTHLPLDPESPKYDLLYQSDGRTYTITFCQLKFPQDEYELGCNNKVYPLPI